MKPLQNTIAVVTGASRGAGRGIAYELGEAGATVYVTGRSIHGSTTDRKQSKKRPQGSRHAAGRGSPFAVIIPTQPMSGIYSRVSKTNTDASIFSSTACSAVRKARFPVQEAGASGSARRNTGMR